ncbi:sensor histidine kinase [Hyalangium versicolor]|uniref:sensor histidine kinase n=1 Tax=Hyalangium versicolor TaxID=2861190 RepID=UPI001CCB23E3|nr:ATP-binding protein [Hyalangium versicolor]
MDTSEPELDSESHKVHARLMRLILTGVVATHLLLIIAVWGQWRTIAIITAVFFFVAGFNMIRARPVFSVHTRFSETLRLCTNTAAVILYGHFTDWALPVWIYLPLDGIWADTHLMPRASYLMFGLFLVVGIVAVLEGCPPVVPLFFILLSALAHAISSVRMELLRRAAERLAQRNQELTTAYQRGQEQDRLSSVGMLAAGLAHEINNPLAYVKSNVTALYRDLKDRRDLSPEMAEYVTEVLPATLDGIQRIATIVSDLRRFARGDPEPIAEYDLNTEVETAVRITQSRLAPVCRLELELGALPRVTGRPRQITQVVINLLLNAAQAMTKWGQVFLSTRQEGEEVVLVVRDTGEGMTPEVQGKLFQPFFSTRPLGEGTGMGLAVVHGIVSAHGGRVQVESQLGKGSTFTIRLPRVPPAAGA